MAKRVFYSFHFDADNWRAAKIRNIGIIEGNQPISDNDWEAIKKGGEKAIMNWIDDQLVGKSCTIVLIGTNTAGRKWINYEIMKSWNDGKGLLGIYIHKITDRFNLQSNKGRNPFETFNVNGIALSNIVKSYDPPGWSSQEVYHTIQQNITRWVDEAIEIRKQY